jgi:hypothetical protein
VTSVDHYGPPTSALDYEPWPLTLSVPSGSLPPEIPEVTWSIHHDDDGPEWFEVASGPSSGTLGDGQSVAVTVLPADWLVSEPGLYEKALPVFDYTYGTRDPFLHRAHVGVDGFTLFPADAFDGTEGLGVPHGASREYFLTNRWIVPQDLTISSDAPWIELNGEDGTIPVHVTLPCKQCAAPTPTIDVSTNGTAMLPGVYSGKVTFSSDDSGAPAFDLTTQVYFDHCRETTADATLPLLNIRLDPGEAHEQHLNVFTATGNVIVDADAIIDVRLPGPGGGTDQTGYSVRLVAPDGTNVLLKDFDDPPQVVFDDETASPLAELLEGLDGAGSIGDWSLLLTNDPDAEKTLKLELHRWEVRLHLLDAPSCEPCEQCGE